MSQVSIHRHFYPIGFQPIKQELHMFSAVSDMAIGHVCYIRSINSTQQVQVSFVSSSSKVSPRCATSIPRLELCAAVEAVMHAVRIISELQNKPHACYFYWDNQIVFSYINNASKSFLKYVERHIELITQLFKPKNSSYVSTKENPVDLDSRPPTPAVFLLLNGSLVLLFSQNPSFCLSPTHHTPRIFMLS